MHGLNKSARGMNRIRPAVWIMALGLTAVAPAKSLARQQVDGGWVGKRVEENRCRFTLPLGKLN
jgi:hypothetical protein